MRRAHYDKIFLTALKMIVDLRQPFLIPRGNQPVVKTGNIAIRFAHPLRHLVDIAAPPTTDQAGAATLLLARMNEEKQQHHLAFTISQTFENKVVLLDRFEAAHRFSRGPRLFRQESFHPKVKIFRRWCGQHQIDEPGAKRAKFFLRHISGGKESAKILVSPRIDMIFEIVALRILTRLDKVFRARIEIIRINFENQSIGCVERTCISWRQRVVDRPQRMNRPAEIKHRTALIGDLPHASRAVCRRGANTSGQERNSESCFMNKRHGLALAALSEHSKLSPLFCGLLASAIFFYLTAAAYGQNSSVDALIRKLPPPEAVAKATAPTTDPAAHDPMVRQIVEAGKAMNFGNAYALSRKLAARYPKSAAAQSLYGQLALVMHRYPEASDAFHKAASIQPNFAFAYVGLGLADAAQNRVNTAMSDFRQVTHLQPAADIGWIGLSACAEKLGHKAESLDYARRATSAAPSSFAAWLQLSREEGMSGNKQAAAKALSRANELRHKAPKTNQR